MTRPARPRRSAKARRLDPRARLGLEPGASAEDAARAHAEMVSFLEGAPQGLRRWTREEIAAADEAYAALSGPGRATAGRGPSPLRRTATAVVALAVTVAVVVAVYDMGGGGKDEAKPQNGGAAEAPALSPGDEARVSRLMRKLKASPRDVATLVQLGNVFFNAHDYNGAGAWMKRAVAIDPGNVSARLALGASEFNLGDVADARRDWLRVVAEDPKNVEAYYDLGFLYVSKDPPEMAEAKKMWGRVVALAPDSAVAKTVATHLKGLEKSASAASAPTGGKG
jgi:cytochrome c-type biogenesis protein CcmH/NrfG